MYNFFLALSGDDYTAARSLFKEYSEALNINLDFQHFDEELNDLQKMYAAPFGGIVLVKNTENELIGCIAIRKTTETTCELKRMYVKPLHQNKGIGKKLLENALSLARDYNYKLVQLDTLDYMLPAINLYKESGFYTIASYYPNPIAGALYFEKKL